MKQKHKFLKIGNDKHSVLFEIKEIKRIELCDKYISIELNCDESMDIRIIQFERW